MGTASSAPCDVASRWWSLNRERFLPSAPLRARAAATLADGTSVDLAHAVVREALRDESPQVRAAAALALGASGAGDAPELLAARLCDRAEEPDVRRCAAVALGRHGSAAARFRLVRALHEGDAEIRPVAALALAASGAGGHGAGLEFACALARSPAAELRTAVLAAASLGSGERVAEAALAALADREPVAAALAVRSGPAPLLDALRRPENLVVWPFRVAIVGALASCPDDEGVGRFLAANLDSGHAERVASLLLAAAPQAKLGPALMTAMREGPKPQRALAGLALAVHGIHHEDASFRPMIWHVSREDARRESRPTWLLALALAGDPAVPALGVELLQRPGATDAELAAAIDALAVSGASSAHELLQRRLATERDVPVLARLADVLGRRGASGDVAALQRAIDAAAASEARDAAARLPPLLLALGHARADGGDRVLVAMARDPSRSPVIRAAALHALSRWSRSRPPVLGSLAHGCAFEWLPDWLLHLLTRTA